MDTNKVAGNFHIALGESENRDERHVHTFNHADMFAHYNISHKINE